MFYLTQIENWACCTLFFWLTVADAFIRNCAQVISIYFNFSWFSSVKLILLDFQPFTQSERFLREGNGVRFRNNLYDITAYVLSFDSDPNWSVTIWRTQTNAISAISTLRVDTGFEELKFVPLLSIWSTICRRHWWSAVALLLPHFYFHERPFGEDGTDHLADHRESNGFSSSFGTGCNQREPSATCQWWKVFQLFYQTFPAKSFKALHLPDHFGFPT